MIPFQKIVEMFDFQKLKEYSHISEILSDQRIKEPITALLSKNPPISIFIKVPDLIFFYAVYISDTLHELIHKIANSCNEMQLEKFFDEILTEMGIQFDIDYYTSRYDHYMAIYAIYFVNLLDEISVLEKTIDPFLIEDIRYFLKKKNLKHNRMSDLIF